ncbi:site-specific DNA-methyltransferase [Streptococcus equinus]|uniref:site-specific DNA-methyltransferase n=1 Tax=Streptococcus equinus TaxID=1335 RepID=UPI000E0712BD|nr:site-specific DNA-methyltransferase [Streptococcus equinus]SUO80334.1 adenine-specific DNA methylase [Streptococcus equinus]
MLKDNRNYNAQVTSNTAFLKMLRDKLPEFFTADKTDEDGAVTSQGTFDIEKFKKALTENSIQTELTSGYQLNFIGKDYAKKQAGEAPTTVVLPDKVHNEQTENQNSQNLFFTGDNLEVLRHLQAGYENSIDVIYIDPPYNTGSDGFVYPDKFEYSDDKLQAMFGMNDEELERLKSIQGKATHSAWLTFMYPRLWLAKRLLKETGVIFVSIDDNEQANLKLLMDEIFGEGNLAGEFPWQSRQSMQNDTDMSNNHEYILAYAKVRRIENRRLKESNAQAWFNSESFAFLPKELDQSRYDNPDNDPRGPWKADPFDAPNYRPNLTYPIKNPNTEEVFMPPRGRHWRTEESKYLKYLEDNRIVFGKNGTSKPQLKVFYEEKKLYGEVENSWWTAEKFGTSTQGTRRVQELFPEGAPFDTPKPVQLLTQLLKLTTRNNREYKILDFFAGSATTADAVMQLNAADGGNRKYIMVQLPEPTFTQNSDGTKVARKGSEAAFNAGYQSIDEISRERIKRASQKIQEEKGLELPEGFDGGFKHYRVLEPTQATLNDLDSFDIESGDFIDNNGNSLLFKESDFDDMISPFSSKGLGFEDGAAGEETILSTWLLADGYSLLSSGETLDLAGYEASYVNSERLYLIAEGWSSEQTKELVNIIGKNEKVIPTIVLYGYSFEMESMRELELALDQLDTKVNLVKRY